MTLSGAKSSSSASSRKVRRVRRVKTGRLPFAPHGLLPFLGLIATLLFGIVPFATSSIESPTDQAARAALQEAGFGWARVEVSGQRVTLNGTPPSSEAAAKAISTVQQVRSGTWLGSYRPVVRILDKFVYPRQSGSAFSPNLATPTPDTINTPDAASIPDVMPTSILPVPSPTSETSFQSTNWVFRLSEGVLLLSGEMPNNDVRTALLAAASDQIDPPRIRTINENLLIGNATDAGEYEQIVMRGLRGLTQCTAGEARYNSNRLSFICEIEEDRSNEVESMMNAPLPFGEIGEIQILARSAVMSCEQNLSSLLDETSIEFASASATIRPASEPLLDLIANVAQACPGRLRIEGHTDNTGTASLNATLSHNRAEAVRSALIERGVTADRLISQGFGSSRPVATNSNETGRARNRRIEIKVVRTTQ